MDPLKLRQALQEADISGAELARRLGLSRQQISDWVRGRSPVPRHRRQQVADVLGKPVEFFSEPHPALLDRLQEIVADREIVRRILTSLGAEAIVPAQDIPFDEAVREWMVSEECAKARQALDQLGTEIRLADLEVLCSLAAMARLMGRPLSPQAIHALFEDLRQDDLAAAREMASQARPPAVSEARSGTGE